MFPKSQKLNEVFAKYLEETSEQKKADLWMQLYKLLQARVRGFCFNRNIRDSDDVVQIALKSIMPNLETFEARNNASFCTWVDSIINRVCCDVVKEIIKHKNDLSLTGQEDGETVDLPELSYPSPEEASLAHFQLERFLSGLDDPQRVIVEMQLDGRNPKEISAETGLSEVAIRKRFSRLRRRLEQKERSF